jgi:hypothetical protein
VLISLPLYWFALSLQMASLAATNWPKPIVLVPCLSWSSATPVFTQVCQKNLYRLLTRINNLYPMFVKIFICVFMHLFVVYSTHLSTPVQDLEDSTRVHKTQVPGYLGS